MTERSDSSGAEFRNHAIDLEARVFEEAGVVDDEVGEGNFGGVGKLGGEAGAGVVLSGGARFRCGVSGKDAGQHALDLQIVTRGNKDDAVEAVAPVGNRAPRFGFEDQGGFDDHGGARVLGKDLVREALLLGDDGRVDDAIQFGEAILSKGKVREAGTVESAVAPDDGGPEGFHDAIEDFVARLHHGACQGVSFEDAKAMLSEYGGYRRFAAAQRARESHTQHRYPMRL